MKQMKKTENTTYTINSNLSTKPKDIYVQGFEVLDSDHTSHIWMFDANGENPVGVGPASDNWDAEGLPLQDWNVPDFVGGYTFLESLPTYTLDRDWALDDLLSKVFEFDIPRR
jgi:hypothetical protein